MRENSKLTKLCRDIKELRNKLYIEGIKHNADRDLLKRVDDYIKGDKDSLSSKELPILTQLHTELSSLLGGI